MKTLKRYKVVNSVTGEVYKELRIKSNAIEWALALNSVTGNLHGVINPWHVEEI